MTTTKTQTVKVSVASLEEKFANFYYTASGINTKTATPLEHLALSQAHGLVVGRKRKSMAPGTPVINYAKSGGRWYAQVGIATGSSVPDAAETFFPASKKAEGSTVFGVKWLTRIVEVPTEFFANQLQDLPHADREPIFNYVVRHSV